MIQVPCSNIMSHKLCSQAAFSAWRLLCCLVCVHSAAPSFLILQHTCAVEGFDAWCYECLVFVYSHVFPWVAAHWSLSTNKSDRTCRRHFSLKPFDLFFCYNVTSCHLKTRNFLSTNCRNPEPSTLKTFLWPQSGLTSSSPVAYLSLIHFPNRVCWSQWRGHIFLEKHDMCNARVTGRRLESTVGVQRLWLGLGIKSTLI